MSYGFDHIYELVPTAALNYETATFGLLLVREGSSAAGSGEPTVTALSGFSSLLECSAASYTRQTPLAGLAIALDTTAHRSGFTFNAINFGNIGGAQVICGAILYLDGASDALRKPLHYFDNAPTFPFTTGRDVIITALSGGSVRFAGV